MLLSAAHSTRRPDTVIISPGIAKDASAFQARICKERRLALKMMGVARVN